MKFERCVSECVCVCVFVCVCGGGRENVIQDEEDGMMAQVLCDDNDDQRSRGLRVHVCMCTCMCTCVRK